MAALMILLGIHAAETSLVVELTNGQKVYYKLIEKPVLTMSDSKIRIESNMVETGYERSNVTRFYFTNEDTGIKGVTMESFMFTQTADDEFIISNVGSERIIVSNLSGHIYTNCVKKSGSDAVVSLRGCTKGVYIIKIGNLQSIKITKK